MVEDYKLEEDKPVGVYGQPEWAISGGISKTSSTICSRLASKVSGPSLTKKHNEAILGPSIQWRPTDNTHLDLVAMAGLTHSAPNAECWLIFGFDFGKGSHKAKGYKPTNVAGH